MPPLKGYTGPIRTIFFLFAVSCPHVCQSVFCLFLPSLYPLHPARIPASILRMRYWTSSSIFRLAAMISACSPSMKVMNPMIISMVAKTSDCVCPAPLPPAKKIRNLMTYATPMTKGMRPHMLKEGQRPVHQEGPYYREHGFLDVSSHAVKEPGLS